MRISRWYYPLSLFLILKVSGEFKRPTLLGGIHLVGVIHSRNPCSNALGTSTAYPSESYANDPCRGFQRIESLSRLEATPGKTIRPREERFVLPGIALGNGFPEGCAFKTRFNSVSWLSYRTPTSWWLAEATCLQIIAVPRGSYAVVGPLINALTSMQDRSMNRGRSSLDFTQGIREGWKRHYIMMIMIITE